MNGSLWWPVIISALGLLSVVVRLTGGMFQPVVIFCFLMVCPGMAFVRLAGVKNSLTEWTLAVALSIAMNTIVAEGMVLAGIWSPQGGLLVLVSASMIGVGIQVIGTTGKSTNLEATER